MSPPPSARGGSPWRVARRRLMQDKPAVVSLGFILGMALVAMLGYLIAPDSTPNANNQHLELSTLRPGFRAMLLLIPRPEAAERPGPIARLTQGAESPYREIPISRVEVQLPYLNVHHFTEPHDSLDLVSQRPLAPILFPGIAPDSLWHRGDTLTVATAQGVRHYTTAELEALLARDHIITRRYWLGTDRFGRDMLSRLILGGSISLSVGFIAVAISLVIGIALGASAGYFRGWFDDLVMWLANVVWAIPTLLMVIALTMVLGKGFWQIFVAVGLTMWVEVARVVRGQVISLREKEFVEAARVMGFSSGRIIFNHILPNVMGSVIIISAGNFATAILLEAGLSFLGIGVQPPAPSWGTMIRDHYGFIVMDKAYLAILPGVAIMLLVLAFTVLGNGLRDALDPKTSGLPAQR